MILTWKVEELRPLFTHARHAPQRRAPYGPTNASEKPSLHLVKDEGIYLMSNGFPGFGVKGERNQKVVYADGFDPAKNDHVWEKSRAAVGGDDFVLDFGHETWMRVFQSDGGAYKRLEVECLGDTFKTYLSNPV